MFLKLRISGGDRSRCSGMAVVAVAIEYSCMAKWCFMAMQSDHHKLSCRDEDVSNTACPSQLWWGCIWIPASRCGSHSSGKACESYQAVHRGPKNYGVEDMVCVLKRVRRSITNG